MNVLRNPGVEPRLTGWSSSRANHYANCSYNWLEYVDYDAKPFAPTIIWAFNYGDKIWLNETAKLCWIEIQACNLSVLLFFGTNLRAIISLILFLTKCSGKFKFIYFILIYSRAFLPSCLLELLSLHLYISPNVADWHQFNLGK